jgi:hypothetical protein
MPKPSLSETLNELAGAQTGRSETSRLRGVFSEVEKALAAGVSRQVVLDALHQDGFTMNLKTFEKALYRIRKTLKEKAAIPVPAHIEADVKTDQQTPKTKPHAFAGLGGSGRDKNAVHHSVPDKDRIYDRK